MLQGGGVLIAICLHARRLIRCSLRCNFNYFFHILIRHNYESPYAYMLCAGELCLPFANMAYRAAEFVHMHVIATHGYAKLPLQSKCCHDAIIGLLVTVTVNFELWASVLGD